MSNKNKIILVFVFLSLLFVIAIAVFIFKKTDLEYLKVVNNNSAENKSAASGGVFKGEDLSKDALPVDEDATGALEKLKKNHPEFSPTQLQFFASTAENKTIAPCENREDRTACVSSVAFISRIYDFCGDIGENVAVASTEKEASTSAEETANASQERLDCYNSILSKKAYADIYKCYKASSTNDDLKTSCLASVFPSSYDKPEDCSAISPEEVRMVCEGIVYYRTALTTNNKVLCEKIKEDFLKAYCLKNI